KLKTLDSKFPKHIEKKSYKKLEKRKKDFYESFRFDNLNKKLYLFSPDLHSLRKKIVKEKNEEIKLNSDTNKEKINYFILKATKEKGELGLHKKNEWKTSNTLGDSKEMNNGDILIIYFVSRASKDNRLKFKEVYQIKNKKVQKNNLIFKVKKIGEFKKPVTYNEFQKDNTISKVIKHKFSKAGQKINNIKINYELYTYLIEILGKGLI
ncbi:MAG: hypothetical protein KAJ51_08750, partial [Thermoplasmata archaeon]|nr:hypothetical protein [Thermoplasmata archaeon]